MNIAYKPFSTGLLMGLMMLWVLHRQLTAGSDVTAVAAIAFIGAHVVFALVLIGGGLLATRLSPRASAWIGRLHRPSARHMIWMLGGAILAISLTHVTAHGLTL